MSFLQPPDSILYPHTVNVWRESDPDTTDDLGKPIDGTWSQVAAGQICYIEPAPSQFGPQLFGQAEGDNMFTLQKVHFPDSADLRPGDVLKITSGSHAGEFRTVKGEPEIFGEFSRKQIVPTNRPEGPPPGVS